MTAYSWLAAILTTLAVGWFAAAADQAPTPAHADQAAQEEADALTSRDWAARQACAGQPFEWLDDKTLICYREQQPAPHRGML